MIDIINIWFNIDTKTLDVTKDVSCKYVFAFDNHNRNIKKNYQIGYSLRKFESL